MKFTVIAKDSGELLDAELTTEHSTSSHGVPVVLVDGELADMKTFKFSYDVLNTVTIPEQYYDELLAALGAAGYL